MQKKMLYSVVLPAALLLSGFTQAQSHPRKTNRDAAADAPITGGDDADTQDQLLKLLRLSPKLTMVVVRDPTLLADQPYVDRNSPELAQFLTTHPEVARNPDFYLFSRLETVRGKRPEEVLERKIWPDLEAAPDLGYPSNGDKIRIVDGLATFAGFAGFFAVLIWLIRILMENRRWTRIFKLQTEVHTRLIERFGSNQELLVYMETEAGKRFLEAAPIPVDFDRGQQPIPGPVSRVLMPLQIGLVLALLGFGLLMLRHGRAELDTPLLIVGVAILMPGIGFIISAGVSWAIAVRLGLMPTHGYKTQPTSQQAGRDR